MIYDIHFFNSSFLRNGTDLANIDGNCFKKFNDPSIAKNKPEVTYPLCGMELHSFMYGSVSSKRCLRRSTKIDISAGTYDQQVISVFSQKCN